MAEFVRVGVPSEFPAGRGRRVDVAGQRVAVFHVDGRWYGLQDDCPHMGASLAEGVPENGQVTCHMHDWVFDLATGEGRPPAKSWACARTYEVKVDSGEVLVRKADPRPEPLEDDWPVWDDDMLRK